jgi:hypothetical protein
MSGNSTKPHPFGSTRKLAKNEDAPQPSFAGRVTSVNRDQHLGRSWPQANGKFSVPIAQVSGLARSVPGMPNDEQPHPKPDAKPSYGQQMPNKGRRP